MDCCQNVISNMSLVVTSVLCICSLSYKIINKHRDYICVLIELFNYHLWIVIHRHFSGMVVWLLLVFLMTYYYRFRICGHWVTHCWLQQVMEIHGNGDPILAWEATWYKWCYEPMCSICCTYYFCYSEASKA